MPVLIEAAKVTEVGQQLLGYIRQAGNDGLTRQKLSQQLGKNVNVWHVAQLKKLESEGLITIELRRKVGTIFEYIYRAV